MKINFTVKHNTLDNLDHRLSNLQKTIVKEVGTVWSKESAELMKEKYLENLRTQGREDEPHLSSATLKLYEQSGFPDGSGIRDHVSVVSRKGINQAVHSMVIESGEPTMIAIVQNDGVVIGVTDKMRGYLAHQGIFLKKETTAIVIPGRESFSKALRDTMPVAKQRLKELLQQWWSRQQNF